MDELDALDCEVDRKKEALASKQAVISLMDCEARIDDWLDRELMSRLALVLSLDIVHLRTVCVSTKLVAPVSLTPLLKT